MAKIVPEGATQNTAASYKRGAGRWEPDLFRPRIVLETSETSPIYADDDHVRRARQVRRRRALPPTGGSGATIGNAQWPMRASSNQRL